METVERSQIRINESIPRLQAALADYIMPDSLRMVLQHAVETARQSLGKVPSVAKVQLVLAKLGRSEQLWQEAVRQGWFPQGILNGHTDFVEAIAFSPDGKTLASTSFDQTVRLWDVRAGQERAVLRGHTEDVRAVVFSLDGKFLLSGGRDNPLRLWNVAARREQAERGYERVHTLALSPDGALLAFGSLGEIGLWDATLVFDSDNPYGASDWKCAVLRRSGDFEDVLSVAFSPDGTVLASGGSYEDRGVYLWSVPAALKRTERAGWTDVQKAAHAAFIPGGMGATDARPFVVLKGHTDAVRSVAFSPDGKTLASGSSDHTVRLWDVGSKRVQAVLRGHAHWVHAVAFSPDGETLASAGGDGTARLWDVANKREKATLKLHELAEDVYDVAFSPDGTVLAFAMGDKTVRLWGVVMAKAGWEQLKQRLSHREQQHREQQRRERERKEREQKEEQQRIWRASGCCEECGVRLGFLDKLRGQRRCHRHR